MDFDLSVVDLVLTILNTTNFLELQCERSSSPRMTYVSCYKGRQKLLDDIPPRNMHCLGRHIKPLGPDADTDPRRTKRCALGRYWGQPCRAVLCLVAGQLHLCSTRDGLGVVRQASLTILVS